MNYRMRSHAGKGCCVGLTFAVLGLFAIGLLAGCAHNLSTGSADAEFMALLGRVVAQPSGALTAASSPSCASSSFCYTFRTNGLPNANFGGIAGADTTCNSDGNKPGAAIGTFKAFLVDPQNNMRRASVTADAGDGQIDWVLQANKQYRRSDGITIVATSNAVRLFTFPLTASFVTGMGGHWTGLDKRGKSLYGMDRCCGQRSRWR